MALQHMWCNSVPLYRSNFPEAVSSREEVNNQGGQTITNNLCPLYAQEPGNCLSCPDVYHPTALNYHKRQVGSTMNTCHGHYHSILQYLTHKHQQHNIHCEDHVGKPSPSHSLCQGLRAGTMCTSHHTTSHNPYTHQSVWTYEQTNTHTYIHIFRNCFFRALLCIL